MADEAVSGITTPKTLDDALAGLFRYWDQRPDGGNRRELMQAAVAAGFEEPLLAIWLDEFLMAFVRIGVLRAPDYDLDLVPKIAEIGIDAMRMSASAVFGHFSRSDGSVLANIRLVASLDVMISDTQVALDNLANDQLTRDAARVAVETAGFTADTTDLLLRMLDSADRQAAPFLARMQEIMQDLVEQRSSI